MCVGLSKIMIVVKLKSCQFQKEGWFNYIGEMKICGDERSIRDILVIESIVEEKEILQE